MFSVSKKKLKKLKIKHCALQRVCQAVGRQQKRGSRRQRERCFTAQNREGNDCQGSWKSSGNEGNAEKEDSLKLSVLPLGGGMMLGGEEREKSQHSEKQTGRSVRVERRWEGRGNHWWEAREWVRTRCQEMIIQLIRELGTRDVKQKAENRRGYGCGKKTLSLK